MGLNHKLVSMSAVCVTAQVLLLENVTAEETLSTASVFAEADLN